MGKMYAMDYQNIWPNLLACAGFVINGRAVSKTETRHTG